jgi:hypothetical protein
MSVVFMCDEHGQHSFGYGYGSPYLEDNSELCSAIDVLEHVGPEKCNLIYKDDANNICVYQVKGRQCSPAFLCNILLVGKNVIKTKNPNVENPEDYEYFTLWQKFKHNYAFVGYFSKQGPSFHNQDKDELLSCICIVPGEQRRGFGEFLFELSYHLLSQQNRTGYPLLPVTDDARGCLEKLHKRLVLSKLVAVPLNIRKDKDIEKLKYTISRETGVGADDVQKTLKDPSIFHRSSKTLFGKTVLEAQLQELSDAVKLTYHPCLLQCDSSGALPAADEYTINHCFTPVGCSTKHRTAPNSTSSSLSTGCTTQASDTEDSVSPPPLHDRQRQSLHSTSESKKRTLEEAFTTQTPLVEYQSLRSNQVRVLGPLFTKEGMLARKDICVIVGAKRIVEGCFQTELQVRDTMRALCVEYVKAVPVVTLSESKGAESFCHCPSTAQKMSLNLRNTLQEQSKCVARIELDTHHMPTSYYRQVLGSYISGVQLAITNYHTKTSMLADNVTLLFHYNQDDAAEFKLIESMQLFLVPYLASKQPGIEWLCADQSNAEPVGWFEQASITQQIRNLCNKYMVYKPDGYRRSRVLVVTGRRHAL